MYQKVARDRTVSKQGLLKVRKDQNNNIITQIITLIRDKHAKGVLIMPPVVSPDLWIYKIPNLATGMFCLRKAVRWQTISKSGL